MAILSYIIFWIPLIAGAHKTSPFVKFHCNQGTVMAICSAALYIVGSILNAILAIALWRVWAIVSFIFTLIYLIPLVFIILGIVNVSKGEMKPLPVIGKFTIIK